MFSCCPHQKIRPAGEDNYGEKLNKDDGGWCTKFWVLPIISFTWNMLSVFITYGIAVGLGHTKADDVPYISHAATDNPETYIFSQCINISAVLLLVIGIFRYLYVKESSLTSQTCLCTCTWQRTNACAFVIGIGSALGFSMLANFPSDTMNTVHAVGGLLGFGGGLIYCIMQTILTWQLRSKNFSRTYVFIAQVINSVTLSCAILIFVITMIINRGSGLTSTKNDLLTTEYKTSSIMEWLTVVLLNTYMLTFIPDFRCMKFRSPQIEIVKE